MSDLSTENYDNSSAKSDTSIDSVKIEQLSGESGSKRSFPLAVVGGFAGSTIAVFLWALLTYLTGYQMLYMPIGIGFIVGFAVRFLGKGRTFPFGLIGAAFSLLGCFFGHFLALVAAAASARGTSIFAILFAVLRSGIDEEFIAETFSTIELALCAATVFIGYILSIYKNDKRSMQ